ncbi:MAG: zf-HC2 domain-containing protein [Acidobacteriota bacterium]
MADILCGYTADRDETLTAYLYGEIDPAPRATFEGHIATCERCRRELADLQAVRLRLSEWSAPELSRSFVRIPAGAAIQSDLPMIGPRSGEPARASSRMRTLPVWAQTAAALLFLGVSAGIANLDVHYGQDGLSIRTGWSRPPVARQGPAPAAVVPAAAPWRADLTALERQLRAEFRTATSTPPAQPASDAAAAVDAQLLRRVRALVEDSERKQQNELALRIAELGNEWETKRKIDLKNIDWNLQAIQKDTGFRMLSGQKQMRAYIDNTATIMSRTQR